MHSSTGPHPQIELAERIFEGFPHGIVVLRADGRVLSANPAALRLLGDPVADPEARCCDLVGCRQPDGPLADICVSEVTAGAGDPLPEVRVDVPAAAPARSCWITAAPLGAEAAQILLEARPARQNDRRRRTEPHWSAAPRLRISVLGPTRVESPETGLEGNWLEQRSGQLLKFLIAERGRLVAAEEIAEAIWPGGDRRVLGNVRHYIHALRERLEPARPKGTESSFIVGGPGGYGLHPDHVELDAEEFEQLVRKGLRQLAAGDAGLAASTLVRAVQLYRGDFLVDVPFAEWAFAERERLRDLAGRALSELSDMCIQGGRLEHAGAYMERLAELHPLDPEVHRRLIELCVARGRMSEAVRRYTALRVRYRQHFNEELDFDLSDVAGPGASQPPKLALVGLRNAGA